MAVTTNAVGAVTAAADAVAAAAPDRLLRRTTANAKSVAEWLVITYRQGSSTRQLLLGTHNLDSIQLWFVGLRTAISSAPRPRTTAAQIQWIRDVFTAADTYGRGYFRLNKLGGMLAAANTTDEEQWQLGRAQWDALHVRQ